MLSDETRGPAAAHGPGPEYADYRLEAGFAFPARMVAIDSAEQHRLHGWCDIPPEVFGAVADPALVSRLPVVMLANTVIAQRPQWGQVHTVQGIVQRRPIALGEQLTMHGRIDRFEPHARGEIVHGTWLYHDAAGDCVFEVHPQALLMDPGIAPARGGAATTTTDDAGYHALLRKVITPAANLGYCEGTYNPVHLDPEAAQALGFRAPIIAGTHTMNFLFEACWRMHAPRAFEATIRFRRPVFWDDVIDIEARAAGTERWQLRALNAGHRCVADCDFMVTA